LELLAGLFNQVVASYPVSAFAALLFLVNWKGYQVQLIVAAKRQLGRGWIAVYLGLLLCSAAALSKPIFTVSINGLSRHFEGSLLLQLGALIDWLSFQFECLFGLLVQIFLVLSVFVWIRGLNADSRRIFELAITRAVYAAKWTGVLLVVTFLLIHLPLLLSYFWIADNIDFLNATVGFVEQTARPLIAVMLIIFCSIQITLALHNESLRGAILEHAEFIRKYWGRMVWFLILAGLQLFGICWISEYFVTGFSKSSVTWILSGALFALVKTFMAAWFLASWVCLYRNSYGIRRNIRF
jgi:hypothetical protein